MPEKIITMIQSSYSRAECRVLDKGKLSEQFEVKSGVRQGGIRSPVLFLLVVNDVLETVAIFLCDMWSQRKCIGKKNLSQQ